MKLHQMIYFQEICRQGYNISKAAEVLHVSQPSISNAIKELEHKMGVQLFKRIDNRLVITRAGAHFLTLVEDLVSIVNSIEDEMRYFSHSETPLRIGVSPMDFSSVYELIFEKFAPKYPELKIEIYETGDMLAQLKEEIIDVAFISGNGFNLNQFNTHLVKSTRLCVFVNSLHPLARASVATKSDLETMKMVLYNHTRLKSFFAKNRISIEVLFYTNQISTMLQMVKANKAGSILLEDVKTSERIKAIPIEGIEPVRIEMVWKKSKQINRPLKQLIAFMTEQDQKTDNRHL